MKKVFLLAMGIMISANICSGVLVYKQGFLDKTNVKRTKFFNRTNVTIDVHNSRRAGDFEHDEAIGANSEASPYVTRQEAPIAINNFTGNATIVIHDSAGDITIDLNLLQTGTGFKESIVNLPEGWTELVENSDSEHVVSNGFYVVSVNQYNFGNRLAHEYGAVTISYATANI